MNASFWPAPSPQAARSENAPDAGVGTQAGSRSRGWGSNSRAQAIELRTSRARRSIADFVHRHRLIEPLQLSLTHRREVEPFAEQQLAHDVRHQHLPRLAPVTDGGRERDSESEEVIVLDERLAGVDTEAQEKLLTLVRVIVCRNVAARAIDGGSLAPRMRHNLYT